MKRLRIIYGIAFVVLLLTEVLIALFVHDGFVRPYIGDLLVTVLLCCFCRTIIPKGVPLLPLYVFLFSVLVEVSQYFNLVKLLGWESNVFLRTIVGTTFAWGDLVCYGVGCLLFWAVERATFAFLRRSPRP